MTADDGGGQGIHARVESVLTEVRVLLDEMRSLRTDTQLGFAAINTRLDSVHERIDGTNVRIDTIIDAVTGLRREFDQHTHE